MIYFSLEHLVVIYGFLPLLSALVFLFVKPSFRSHLFAVTACLCHFILASVICIVYEYTISDVITFEIGGFSSLLPSLHFTLSNLNVVLFPLSSLIYFLVIVSSSNVPNKRINAPAALVSLGFLTFTLLSHESLQLVLFYILQMIPPYLEIKRRKENSSVYCSYMSVSILLLLSGFFLRESYGYSFFGGALITGALLIRAGIFPLHSWMNHFVHSVSLSSAICYLTPLSSAYVFILLVLPHSPVWALQSVVFLSLITALYASGLLFVQKDIRGFYSSLFLSNAALIFLGLELATPMGVCASLCIWISSALALTGFGIAMQLIESRIGRVELRHYHGLYNQMPEVAGFFLISGLATVGFPLTIGFVSLELLVDASVHVYPFVGVLVIVTAAINSIGILFCYFRIFTGKKIESSYVLSIKPKERFAILLLLLFIIIGGLIPQPGVISRYEAALQILKNKESMTFEHDIPRLME